MSICSHHAAARPGARLRPGRVRRAPGYCGDAGAPVRLDRLTGLLDRAAFEARLSSTLDALSRRTHALLYLDLDQFKVVNDASGYRGGDDVLRQVGALLGAVLQKRDVLARAGGDSFVMLLHDCPIEEAVDLAERLRVSIAAEHFAWRERRIPATVSIGVAAVRAGQSAAALLNLAEVACLEAKDRGRNRVHLYSEAGIPRKHRELRCVWSIGQALQEDRLELYFQPITPIGSQPDGNGRGYYELLLRIRDDRGRLVPAAEFVPVAERYDLVSQLDRWVIREVLSRWLCREDQPAYTLAVNLSGGSINDPRFLDALVRELETRRLPQGSLCFEITETSAIGNLQQARRFMHELKRLGVRFALDDFGCGMSSFAYLRTLPVDSLKIDGQFVKNVARDAVDRTLVKAISRIGKELCLDTVAECVESADALRTVARLGVGYAQGTYVGRPRPIEELRSYERQERSATSRSVLGERAVERPDMRLVTG